MDRRKFFFRIAGLVIFLCLINFLATELYWYSLFWWFDMVMHFLGGFWLGLMALWFIPIQKLNFTSVFKIIFIVLFLGVAWELFEIVVNNQIAQNPFDLRDTISDLFFDTSGGFFAVFYYFSRIMRFA